MIRLQLNQTAELFRKIGTNSVGDSEFDNAESVSCRWENKMELYKDADGREITSNAVVFFHPNTGIQIGDGVRLDGDSTNPKIIRAIERIPDLHGNVPYEAGVL